jgi:hypothetical protein
VIVLARFAGRLSCPAHARTAAALVFMGLVTLAGCLPWLSYGFNTTVIESSRGRLKTHPQWAAGMPQVIDYVREHTTPSDFVAVVPEERFINFFSERRHPTRDPGVGPHWLATPEDEARFVAEVLARPTPLLIVSRRAYVEFHAGRFQNYGRRVMKALERDYELVETMDMYEIFRRRPRR